MSRPSKTEAAKLSRQIIFRVKSEEYEQLQEQAKLVGLSVNQLARKLTCQRMRKLVITTYKRIDPIFIKQLQKLAHNVNQLTKNAHIFKRVSPNLDSLCMRIEQLIDKAVNEEVDD